MWFTTIKFTDAHLECECISTAHSGSLSCATKVEDTRFKWPLKTWSFFFLFCFSLTFFFGRLFFFCLAVLNFVVPVYYWCLYTFIRSFGSSLFTAMGKLRVSSKTFSAHLLKATEYSIDLDRDRELFYSIMRTVPIVQCTNKYISDNCNIWSTNGNWSGAFLSLWLPLYMYMTIGVVLFFLCYFVAHSSFK